MSQSTVDPVRGVPTSQAAVFPVFSGIFDDFKKKRIFLLILLDGCNRSQ